MNNNPRDDWRREVREGNAVARSVGWRASLWIVAIVIGVGVLSGGIWAFKVATSDVKGAGDATRITNDGRNRINAQEWFHGQYEQVKSADKRLDRAAADLRTAEAAKATDLDFYRTNLTGLTNRCLEMVGNYNAEANKVSRGKWRDPALPFQLDDTDPATDCKPDTATEGNPR